MACFTSHIPEVLDVVLHSTEAQRMGQSLVVGQGLGGRAPVHIWPREDTRSQKERRQRGAWTLCPAGAKLL